MHTNIHANIELYKHIPLVKTNKQHILIQRNDTWLNDRFFPLYDSISNNIDTMIQILIKINVAGVHSIYVIIKEYIYIYR